VVCWLARDLCLEGAPSPVHKWRGQVVKSYGVHDLLVRRMISRQERIRQPWYWLSDSCRRIDEGKRRRYSSKRGDQVWKSSSSFERSWKYETKLTMNCRSDESATCYYSRMKHEQPYRHRESDGSPYQSCDCWVRLHENINGTRELLDALQKRVESRCNRSAAMIRVHAVKRRRKGQDRVGVRLLAQILQPHFLLIVQDALKLKDRIFKRLPRILHRCSTASRKHKSHGGRVFAHAVQEGT
jgi:hypothetical protein